MRFAGGLNDYVLTIDHDEGEAGEEGGREGGREGVCWRWAKLGG